MWYYKPVCFCVTGDCSQAEGRAPECGVISQCVSVLQVIAPKLKGEPLGVVIVESGWGSMVPTVVLANMNPSGAAARCGQLNIGDQIMSVNGVSLVGLPLSSCQTYIKVRPPLERHPGHCKQFFCHILL